MEAPIRPDPAPRPEAGPLAAPQALAEHVRFVRGLAGRLVADPASADDAAQDAWLAAVRRPPAADRPLRPWLARVVTNAVAKLRRGAGRRAARERAVARPEAARDPASLLERERLLRLVLDAVLTLPDGQREVVLLRYYEGLPPRDIAQRLRLPAEHVSARLARGVASLRARLDAEHAGVRRAWLLPLAGAFGVPSSLMTPVSAAAAAAGASSAGSVPTAVSAGALAVPASAVSLPFLGALAMSSTAATVTAVVVSLGAGLGAGWFLRAGSSEPAPETLERPAAGRDGAALSGGTGPRPERGPELAGQDPALKVVALEKARAGLEQQNAALEAKVAALEEQVKALAPTPFDPKSLRFGLTGATPAFDKADWTALSGHMSEMAKVMPRFREQRLKGGEFPSELIQDLQEHNTPLAIFAVGTASELKGTGPNGAFTHPAVIANLMRAALLAANDPLTAAQETSIVTLGNVWAAEEERALKGVAADAPALARTVVEVDAKERFLDAARGLLTPSQRQVLWHPDTEGRLMLDLLSPALVYIMVVPAESLDPAQLPGIVVKKLLDTAGAKDVDAAALAFVGERWLDDVPRGREPRDMKDPDLLFPTVTSLQAYARAQVNAVVRLGESGRLSAEQLARVKRLTALVVPYAVRAP